MEDQLERDTRPSWMKENEVAKGSVIHDGQEIPFTVLRKELEPLLPGFLGYLDAQHLFISEEVPEEFRIPQLIHEVIEFKELKDQKGRCVEALKRELDMIPEEIRQRYVEYRLGFFARLIEFYKDQDREDLKTEIRASYDFLKTLN